jgi:predicted DNA-binding transcriptional regulator AlpA
MHGAERMTVVTAEFLLPSEVQEITRLRDPTRRRLERRGLFPARIHIAPRRIAWRCADVLDWCRDPEGWSRRQKEGAGEPCRDDLAEDL